MGVHCGLSSVVCCMLFGVVLSVGACSLLFRLLCIVWCVLFVVDCLLYGC